MKQSKIQRHPAVLQHSLFFSELDFTSQHLVFLKTALSTALLKDLVVGMSSVTSIKLVGSFVSMSSVTSVKLVGSFASMSSVTSVKLVGRFVSMFSVTSIKKNSG